MTRMSNNELVERLQHDIAAAQVMVDHGPLKAPTLEEALGMPGVHVKAEALDWISYCEQEPAHHEGNVARLRYYESLLDVVLELEALGETTP